MAPVRLISVVGARPQFVKLAPVCRALADLAPDWAHYILHTGQHYDYGMSEVFFEDLNMPRPDTNLNIGSGKHGAQTGAMIAALEEQFEVLKPAGILIYGDTNSTLAASIAGSKLHIPQFHVESGLRSFDRRMPEEVNRVVADHCSDLLFAPTGQAMRNLHREGLADRAINAGDVMYDAVLYNADIARQNSNVMAGLDVKAREYAVVTIHRASNTEVEVLDELLETLAQVSRRFLPILFPMHPRTKAIAGALEKGAAGRVQIMEPQSYLDMLSIVMNAKLVLTDSGGLQKEAAFLGVPCITLRDSTEWTETIDIGANTLAGLSRDTVLDAVGRVLARDTPDWSSDLCRHYGAGCAAEKIVSAIIDWYDDTCNHEKQDNGKR